MKNKSIFQDERAVRSPWKSYLGLSVTLFGFWFLLSGRTEPKFLGYGAVTSLLAAYVCLPLLFVSSRDGEKKCFLFFFSSSKTESAMKVTGRMLAYWGWLIKELFLANVEIERAVLRQEEMVNPCIVRFQMDFSNPTAHAVLANSITLTPGTITLDVSEKGVYTIHCLTEGAKDGLLSGEIQNRVARLFGESCEYVVLEGGNTGGYSHGEGIWRDGAGDAAADCDDAAQDY